MARGVQAKGSHDISFAMGKGLQGLKVEATMAGKGGKGAGPRGRTLLETVMLGCVTVAAAAIPVVVMHVPAPETLVVIKEVLQEWCTPSICFGVLIIGVLVVTLGGGGAGAEEVPATPEKFADSYLPQLGPVAASQIDPLRMPDIFFSPEAARLTHSASFPASSSVMVPVYYPAFSHSEKELEFSGRERFVDRFGPPGVRDRFSPRIDDRFSPRVDDRFSGRGDDRFGPRVEDWFSAKVDNRFAPRMDERFSPRVEDRFGSKLDERYVPDRYAPQVEERYAPQVDERYTPQVDERYAPQVDERYAPHVDERYAPQVEERYAPQVEERYVPQVEERYEPQEEERYIPQVEERYIPQVEERYVPQVEERYIPQVEERYESQEEEDAYEPEEEEARYGAHMESRAHFEPEQAEESDREDEVEYIESEAEDEGGEPEPEPQTESEPEPEEPPAPEPLPSPPVAPESPPAPQPPPPAAATSSSLLSRQTSAASSTLLSRRKPPVVPTPVLVPPPPPPEPKEEPKVVKSKVLSPPQPETSPKMSVRVGRRETPEMSPSTPPKHSRERRSSSSRSYGEFVRSTIDCPLPTLKPLSKVASSPTPKRDAAPETLDEKLAKMKSRRFSTGGISLQQQQQQPAPLPNKRPREVRVVDDDKELEAADPGQEDDDVDQRVEAFLQNFREQMRLQRQESLSRHRRGAGDVVKP